MGPEYKEKSGISLMMELMRSSGIVGWSLLVLSLILWYSLVERLQIQDQALMKTLTRSCVIVAPLLGLLGTVTGMIETFVSLKDMSLHAASGGVSGGISQALLTTQMGLVVAIPGLIADRMLRARGR